MRIIGIDPGQTTGVVSFHVDNNEITEVESYSFDLVSTGRYIEEVVKYDPIFVYEVANKFQPSGHVSSEIIGILKFFTGLCGCKAVPVIQSSHKNLITRDILKRAGLYVKGNHAKDAASVALYYVVTWLDLCHNYLTGEGGDHGSGSEGQSDPASETV